MPPLPTPPDYAAIFGPLVGDRLRLQEPLARYTVARLGGPADCLIVVESAAMLETVCRAAWAANVPIRILGGGANVLISDAGVRGLVVINHARAIQIESSGLVVAESGAVLPTLARQTIEAGLSGFEWAIGVPGTLGGAVVGNAGAHGRDIAADLLWAEIATAGQPTERWPHVRLAYAYRESALKGHTAQFTVLRAALQLRPGHDPAVLMAEAEAFNQYRRRTQPPGASLGSMFKNPLGDYAGRLIEAAGLKGTTIGGVTISPVHANFFVNRGDGTAADYLALIRLAQARVHELFGVNLQLEVELVGEFSPPPNGPSPRTTAPFPAL